MDQFLNLAEEEKYGRTWTKLDSLKNIVTKNIMNKYGWDDAFVMHLLDVDENQYLGLKKKLEMILEDPELFQEFEEMTIDLSDIIRPHKAGSTGINIPRLEAIPTAEFAFEEIAGDPDKYIVYYKNGVLTKKDGLGNETQYVNSDQVLRMDILKYEQKQSIIESDADRELQARLIKEVNKIIDEYIDEKGKSNGI